MFSQTPKYSNVFLLVIHLPIKPLPSLKPAVMSVRLIKSTSFWMITDIADAFTCKILFFAMLYRVRNIPARSGLKKDLNENALIILLIQVPVFIPFQCL